MKKILENFKQGGVGFESAKRKAELDDEVVVSREFFEAVMTIGGGKRTTSFFCRISRNKSLCIS